MEANLHSGKANNKNLGCLENVSSMNLLFRIFRMRFQNAFFYGYGNRLEC